jgi:predicted metalloprotease with PDZ domain
MHARECLDQPRRVRRRSQLPGRVVEQAERHLLLGLLLLSAFVPVSAQSPVHYRFTFPEPEHHWMQVEAVFADLDPGPLELRMSRSSPGRYSLHDFAKNVYDVTAIAGDGRELPATRPDPYGWTVTGHDGELTVRYKVFGDRVDGTYLAIDPTHAHVNMPAALMWARGLDDRPAVLAFESPAGRRWRAATQLFPGAHPLEFTAPNLQYLMDSPVEFGPGDLLEFDAGGRTIRVNLHHDGTEAEARRFTADVERVVREQREIFGEYPVFEPGHYTFLADYLPYASGDGMEHRNSTVVTASGSIGNNRIGLLGTVSHEFLHAWNVERIRPRTLEPFDFERANLSGELWLAEGFTSYYGPLTLHRAGLVDLGWLLPRLNGMIGSVVSSPARLVRSAEEMSHMAAFIDGGQTTDRTNWATTVVSYYSYGAAVGLALDLSLRERSDGKVTLDDYMRAMWRAHGAPGGSRPGSVDRPYTMADAEACLAEVAGDASFARQFFARFIQGHDVADYRRLLEAAGLVLRSVRPGRAWIGDLRFEDRGRVHIVSPPGMGSPAYVAGLDLDDEVRRLDGRDVRSVADVADILSRRRPGDRIEVTFADRTGVPRTSVITLGEDPALELVPIESTGGVLTAAQKAFRARWLD